jgi:hypothetical protein
MKGSENGGYQMFNIMVGGGKAKILDAHGYI